MGLLVLGEQENMCLVSWQSTKRQSSPFYGTESLNFSRSEIDIN